MSSRVVVGALSGVVTASQRLTLYQDLAAQNQVLGGLKQRGFREIVAQVYNPTGTMTFEISQTSDLGNSYVMYDTFTVPIYSATNKNTFAYDLTGLQNVLVQLVDTGAGQASGFRATLEANLDVQDIGCSND